MAKTTHAPSSEQPRSGDGRYAEWQRSKSGMGAFAHGLAIDETPDLNGPYDPPIGGGAVGGGFDPETERCPDCDGHFKHSPGCPYYVDPATRAEISPEQKTKTYLAGAKAVRATLREFDETGATPTSALLDAAWYARKALRDAVEEHGDNEDGDSAKTIEAMDRALGPVEGRFAEAESIDSEPPTPYSEKVALVAATREALTRTDQSALPWRGETADGWKAKARASRQRSAESFERSDTDGYLSQWAADKMASKYDFCATIAENGGVLSHVALFDLEGNLVRAKEVETRYGLSWMLMDEDGNATGWVNPSKANTPEKRAVANAKKGYRLGRVMVPMTLNTKTGDPFRADDGYSADNEVLYVISADGTHPLRAKVAAEGGDFNEWYD